VPVLGRLVEDRRQRVDQLLDRGGTQPADTAAAAVADHRAGGGELAQLLRLAQLVGLEGEAQFAVDLVQPAGAKNPSRWPRRQR
jgi:hypothetical protein